MSPLAYGAMERFHKDCSMHLQVVAYVDIRDYRPYELFFAY